MVATWALSADAAAADGLLHLVRRRLVDGNLGLGGREQGDAASLADDHGGLHVALEEEPLDGDPVRPVLGKQLAQRRVQTMQPLRLRDVGWCSDDPRVDELQPAALEPDDPEAARCRSGVDPHDDHRRIVSRHAAGPSFVRSSSYSGLDIIRQDSYIARAFEKTRTQRDT